MKLRPDEITSILKERIEQYDVETDLAEVAELTLIAATKVTGKALDDADHRRLIDEAIRELDFSALEEAEAR